MNEQDPCITTKLMAELLSNQQSATFVTIFLFFNNRRFGKHLRQRLAIGEHDILRTLYHHYQM